MSNANSVWENQSCWYIRDLTSEHAARYLDDSGLDSVAGFFARHQSRDLWTLAEIYNHIIAQHPLDARVPRLFPFGARDPQAFTPKDCQDQGRLLYTQIVEIPSHSAQFVVHAWDPRDNRGSIAVGYPVRDCLNATTSEAADALLGALPWASAAIIPSGIDVSAPFTESGAQPGIWVADGRITRTHDQVGVTTEHYGWADLANLLRVDLPWWPVSLRDRDAMLAWRPGDVIKPISPGTTIYDPTAFSALPTTQSSSTVRDTVAKAIRIAERIAAGTHLNQQGIDHFEPFPGLQHAATSARSDYGSTSRESLNDGELTLLLHQRVPDHSAGRCIARILGQTSVISGYHRVDPSVWAHRLAQPFLDRLVPALNPDEIGFRYLDHYLSGPEKPEFLAHPYWPDCWIARQGAITYLTVGSSVPSTGYARLVHLRPDYGFFRDSTGAVWPVPRPETTTTDWAADLAAVAVSLTLDGGATAIPASFWGFTPPQEQVDNIKSGGNQNYVWDPPQ